MHGSCSTTASHILKEMLHYRRRFSGSDQDISLENDIVTLTQLPRIQTFISANLPIHFILPAFPIENVVDPTGAGDTFAGAFFGYLAKRDKAEDIVDMRCCYPF